MEPPNSSRAGEAEDMMRDLRTTTNDDEVGFLCGWSASTWKWRRPLAAIAFPSPRAQSWPSIPQDGTSSYLPPPPGLLTQTRGRFQTCGDTASSACAHCTSTIRHYCTEIELPINLAMHLTSIGLPCTHGAHGCS